MHMRKSASEKNANKDHLKKTTFTQDAQHIANMLCMLYQQLVLQQ